jgi:hypothetical protein
MKLYCIRKTESLDVWCEDAGRIQCIGRIMVDNPGSPLAADSLLRQMEQLIGEISYQYLEEGPDDPLPVDRSDAEKALERLRSAHGKLTHALTEIEDAMDLLPETVKERE